MKIDFFEPKLPSRRAWCLASLPALVAVVMWGAQLFLHTRLEAQRKQLEAAESATTRPLVTPELHRPAQPYQTQALAAIRRAALPEADALAELEHVEVAGIQLRFIDVNAAQGGIVVELDATSDDVLADYLDQLNAGDGQSRWHIQKLAARSGQVQSSTIAISAGAPAIDGHTVFISRGL